MVNVKYDANGKSMIVNQYGMREMQERAYKVRNAQYILIKAPPASGKSRALMFIALDKLVKKKVEKVIVAVPERSIGKSFASTELKSTGFHSDWTISDEYNLCTPGGVKGKVDAFESFFNSDETLLLCTHATLRFAFDRVGAEKFNDTLVAVDEFHHVSADYESKLGELVRGLMTRSNSHILAMTGSYFRGDCVPVLMHDEEARFVKVTYNYYEQLNGYKYLKSLGIGYHFYVGIYTSAIHEVLDTNKKTILHIPPVGCGESTQDKYNEVDAILDMIGKVNHVDEDTKIITVERPDGKLIKVADLVNDDPNHRDCTIRFLRDMSEIDDVDLIIALGMAKEGFDWPYCEHALTVGYRGSLTEIIQIIGRCTRDSSNKTHAQFTNLVAEPDTDNETIIQSVNNMLKAITASLLMEQVLAPNFKFKSKDCGADDSGNTICINGFRDTGNPKVETILESDMTEIKTSIMQDDDIIKSLSGIVDPEVINKIMIPKVIRIRYPHLDDEEVEEVRQHVVADLVLKRANVETRGNSRFIEMGNEFINIEEIDMDLIDKINPFQKAFEVISKSVTPRVLKAIQECIRAFKVNMTDDEALHLWPKINNFVKATGRPPNLDSLDPAERRLAEALVYLKHIKRAMVEE